MVDSEVVNVSWKFDVVVIFIHQSKIKSNRCKSLLVKYQWIIKKYSKKNVQIYSKHLYSFIVKSRWKHFDLLCTRQSIKLDRFLKTFNFNGWLAKQRAASQLFPLY